MKKLNQVFCAEVLNRFFQTVGHARFALSEQIDIEDELLLKLLNITLEEREMLITAASKFITVEIDFESLDNHFGQTLDKAKSEDLENEFLLLGAPLGMMRELFGMHASEFSLRRRVLGIGGKNRGRPSINEQSEYKIWKVWRSVGDDDQRARYLKTAELSGETLLSVWTALKKLDQERAEAPPAPSNRSRYLAAAI